MEAAAKKYRERPRIDQKKKPRPKKKKQTRKKHRINTEMLMYTALYSAVLIFVIYKCASYLKVCGNIEQLNLDIAKLEKEVNQKIEENNALEQSLNTAIDLEELFYIATTELGMVFPDKNEVIFYESSPERGHVIQYRDIPKE